jgi:RNase adapter protein RapZ
MSASQNPQGRTQVVVVTGLSGAGKSTAIHALEDLGFYCCDNLPTGFAPEMVDLCERGGIHRIALGFDARLGNFLVAIDEVMDALDASGTRDLHVMFIDASDESIVRRFSETRRPHPLAPEGDVLEGIQIERERLAPLRARATRVIDTTRFTVHELRRALVAQFSQSHTGGELGRMMTRIVSFGFKFGAPVDCDIVLDVRFLANPFFVPHMKHRPGTDADVASFVLDTNEAQLFLSQVEELLASTIPLYAREGKAYLTIGIGCTGGRHRSVAMSEELCRRLRGRSLPNVHVLHRDVARGDVAGSRGSDPGPIEPPFLPYTRPSHLMEERQSGASPQTDKTSDTPVDERRGT